MLELNDAKAKKAAAQAEPELPLESPARTAKPLDAGDAGAVTHLYAPLDRPGELPGRTYKLRWPDSDHAIYITLNDILDDSGRIRPFEIFINSKNTEHYAWTVALTRLISAVFRRGGDVSFVVEGLKAVFDPRGGYWVGGKYVPSLLAAIGSVIENHMIDTGFMANPAAKIDPALEAQSMPLAIAASGANNASGDTRRGLAGEGGPGRSNLFKQCPKCGQPSLMRQEGCDTCTSCGHSKCG